MVGLLKARFLVIKSVKKFNFESQIKNFIIKYRFFKTLFFERSKMSIFRQWFVKTILNFTKTLKEHSK